MENQRQCSQPGCTAPSGVCLDGFAKYSEECPNWLASQGDGDQDEGGIEDALGSELPTPEFKDVVPTSMGSTLDYVDCDKLLRRGGGHLISVVSGPKAGKTSLVTALYEFLSRGLWEDCIFAGSETLLGFEERCHFTRLASGRATPDMLRTRVRSTASILHIAANKQDGITHYFFLDRSGENFDDLVATPALAENYSDLERADEIWFLLDGAILLNNPARATASVRRMFQAVLQVGFLTRKRIALVVTKADLLAQSGNADPAATAVSDFAQELTNRLNGQPVEVVRTSAHSLERGGQNAAAMRSLLADREEKSLDQYERWRKDVENANSMEMIQKLYEELP
jgi:hypothetical protein